MEQLVIIKIFFLTTLSFVIAMAWTPMLTHFLYKYKLGKKIRNVENAPIMFKLHQVKAGTPMMGGILIWGTTLIIAVVIFILSKIYDSAFTTLNFLSRSQTWLPLGALVATALVGLVDDVVDLKSDGKGGLRARHRLFIYALIALFGVWWFYFKLGWDLVRVPFVGNFELGWLYIPIFIFIIVATAFSVNEADGLDGLAGGMLLISFGAYGAIAFSQGKYDLASFCGVIIGALVAFLWFNINPARFFMGDTGAMPLGITLGIIAMLTNYGLLMPIIGFMFMIESLSVIIQNISKKFRGKKIWLSTPIHHHFEAKGWPEAKIVMRFWLISGVMAVVGLIVVLMDKS